MCVCEVSGENWIKLLLHVLNVVESGLHVLLEHPVFGLFSMEILCKMFQQTKRIMGKTHSKTLLSIYPKVLILVL